MFLRAADAQVVSALLSRRGVTVGQGRQFEPLDMDAQNNILGPDIDMQEPERGYVPAKILHGRTEHRIIELGAIGRVEAIVPTAPALLFMKLKAYHDRQLSWSALRDDAIMATRIPTADRPQVRMMTVTHYYRKAGKDLPLRCRISRVAPRRARRCARNRSENWAPRRPCTPHAPRAGAASRLRGRHRAARAG